MTDGMKSKMQVGDKQVQFSLKCAQCGQDVESGQSHVCKQEEKVNEGSCGKTNPDPA